MDTRHQIRCACLLNWSDATFAHSCNVFTAKVFLQDNLPIEPLRDGSKTASDKPSKQASARMPSHHEPYGLQCGSHAVLSKRAFPAICCQLSVGRLCALWVDVAHVSADCLRFKALSSGSMKH